MTLSDIKVWCCHTKTNSMKKITSLTDDKDLTLHLYKSRASLIMRRSCRVNTIINPIYYLSLEKENYNDWAYYDEIFLENIFPEKPVFQNDRKKSILYLLDLAIKNISWTKEYRRVVADRLSEDEQKATLILLEKNGITIDEIEEIALGIAIAITEVLQPKMWKVIAWEKNYTLQPLYELSCIYQLYWEKGKTRFLITEETLIHTEFEYPSGIVVYHANSDNPILLGIMSQLDALSLKEDVFRMIETHLEKSHYCDYTKLSAGIKNGLLIKSIENDKLMQSLKIILSKDRYLFLLSLIRLISHSFSKTFICQVPMATN